jgi:hypothetical protein
LSTAKAWVQAAFAVLAAVVPALAYGWPLSLGAWINVVILGATAVGVYNAANLPGWNVAKTIAAALGAVAALLVSFLSDNQLGADEVVQLILAAAAAIGVYVAPGPTSTPRHAA